MSLASQLANLATRVGTEFKAVRSSIGSLTSLSTTEKGTIVGAINEIKAGVEAGGDITVDAITDTAGFMKSFLKTANASAARTAIGAGTGNSNLIIGTTASDTKAGNYVPTWAEITSKPAVIASGADSAAARTAIGAQSAAEVDAKIAALVNGSGATLDTLKELADALGGDANFATTISTALGNRVRVDAAQSFTEPQKLQARSNIDVHSKSEIGNPEADLVATFEAALV